MTSEKGDAPPDFPADPPPPYPGSFVTDPYIQQEAPTAVQAPIQDIDNHPDYGVPHSLDPSLPVHDVNNQPGYVALPPPMEASMMGHPPPYHPGYVPMEAAMHVPQNIPAGVHAPQGQTAIYLPVGGGVTYPQSAGYYYPGLNSYFIYIRVNESVIQIQVSL